MNKFPNTDNMETEYMVNVDGGDLFWYKDEFYIRLFDAEFTTIPNKDINFMEYNCFRVGDSTFCYIPLKETVFLPTRFILGETIPLCCEYEYIP